MKVFVYTLGCRLNQCESEALMDAFIRAGFEKAENAQESDLVVVNTCTVTSKAEQKARRMVRLFAKSAEAVIVTGCYAEMDRSEIERLGDNIHVYGLREKGGLLKLPEHIMASLATTNDLNLIISSFKDEERGPFIFDASSFSYHSRAYLKIQDGCDNSCSYCRTTIARGPSVSLDADEVVKRAKKIEEEGLHEIMLTGVNLTMYNHDSGGLGELTERLLSELGPDMRIRFSSLEADHVDDRLLSCFKDERIFPRRLAIVYLMSHRKDYEDQDMLLSSITDADSSEYYISMAVAWALSFFYIDDNERALPYFDKVSEQTRKRAWQKVRDSRRTK